VFSHLTCYAIAPVIVFTNEGIHGRKNSHEGILLFFQRRVLPSFRLQSHAFVCNLIVDFIHLDQNDFDTSHDGHGDAQDQ
jgi:hypothetical protein